MAGSAGLPLAGVEAIVEGLSTFQSDTRKMNSALDSIRPRSTLLMRSFESLTTGIVNFGKGLISGGVNALASFGKSLIHIAEVALGVLFRDAINAAIGWVKDFIQSTIEAGSELQLLQLRLDRLNFNELKKSGQEYTDITAKAIEMTKEQMNWLIKLAAQTPYNNTDIANVYTLARSYGFASDEADNLTQDIVDFASGMGLTEEHIKRIIINFGQMKQQGKITGMELRDLARGAFVPVNDILARVADSLGLTSEQLDKLRKKGATDAEDFIMAFAQMVDEDFEGAAANMRRALVPAIENIQETFRSLMSWNVVKPIMDSLGGKLSDVTDEIVNNETMWNRLTTATERIGTTIVGIMEDLLGLAPDAATIADKLVGGVEKLATWVEEHRDDIVGFFKDKLLPAIQGVFTWIVENGPGVMQFFRELGGIVGGVAEKIGKAFSFGGGKEQKQSGPTGYFPGADAAMQQQSKPFGVGILDAVQKIADFITNNLVPALDKFFKWVEENGPLIEKFFETLGEIVSTVFTNLTKGSGGEGKGDFLSSVTEFMQFVVENKDKIAEWVEILVRLVIVWQVLATIWSTVMGIVLPLIGFVLGLVAAFSGLVTVLSFLGGLIAPLLPILAGLAAAVLAVIVVIKFWQFTLDMLKGSITIVLDAIKERFQLWKENVLQVFDEMIEAGKNGDWVGIGKAIIDGIKRHIDDSWTIIRETIVKLFNNMIAAAKKTLGISSPSTVFAGIGRDTIAGMVKGIKEKGALIKDEIQKKIDAAIAAVENTVSRWTTIGQLMMAGLVQGIKDGASAVINAIAETLKAAVATATTVLDENSPSKVFEEIGGMTMKGFAQGVEKFADLAYGAVSGAMASATMPALATTNNYSTVNNVSMTVNTAARHEPIIQDYNMLMSMVG